MNPYLVVRIHIPRKENKKRVGTGYVLAPNLIITAYHVLHPTPTDREENLPITVEWKKLGCVAPVKCLRSGSWEQYDIAILECDFPEHVLQQSATVPIFARQAAVSKSDWESAGYPKLNKFELKDAVGTFGANLDQCILNLNLVDTIDRANVPDDVAEKPWGGMSGAPVFDVKTKQFRAVITKHTLWMQREVGAVSLPWLLANDMDFKQLIDSLSSNACEDYLNKKLQTELNAVLTNRNLPVGALSKELKLPKEVGDTEIVRYLVNDLGVGDALSALTRLCEQHQLVYGTHSERWFKLIYAVEQICGWLLLKTVKQEWWIEHEARFSHHTASHIGYSFEAVSAPYVEVIISRQFLQRPSYKLDAYGYAVPIDRYDETVLLFDAISPEASDIQILTPIFKDLRRSPTVPANVNDLIMGIKRSVEAKLKARLGKPIYYLVSDEYFQLLKKQREVFDQLETDLAGKLQFISCIGEPTSSNSINPSNEDQEAILDQLAEILRFRES